MLAVDRPYDAYIFDLDGTVYLGDALLPTAGETNEMKIAEAAKKDPLDFWINAEAAFALASTSRSIWSRVEARSPPASARSSGPGPEGGSG